MPNGNARFKAVYSLYLALGAMLLADGDYPGTHSVSQPLGRLLFTHLWPGALTPFELIGYGLALALLLRAWRQRAEPWLRFAAVAPFALAATGLVLTGALAALHGLNAGGQLKILAVQLRGLPLFSCWALCGFLALDEAADAPRLLAVMAGATVVKSLEDLVVLAVNHQGALDPKLEFLQSHIASLFMGATLVWLLLHAVYLAKGWWRGLDAVGLALVFYIWLINNRRVSMLGLAFTAIFGLGFVYPYVAKRHYKFAVAAAALAAVFVAATWSGKHGLASLLIKDPNAEIDYRELENYDLYRGVAVDPWLGQGYGFPFKQYLPLPDIGFDRVESLNYVPHNNILMIWSFGGPLGLAGLGMGLALFIAALVRLFHQAREPALRVFAYTGFSIFVQWTLYIWADMAFNFKISPMLPGIVGGFAFKLLYLGERQPEASASAVEA